MDSLDQFFQNHDTYKFYSYIRELARSVNDQTEPSDIEAIIDEILQNTTCNNNLILKKAREMKFKIENLFSDEEYKTVLSIINNVTCHYKSVIVLIDNQIVLFQTFLF